jgi:hypothetical protein
MFTNTTKTAFNKENQPYVEVFKEWLEDNGHTSALEAINWESPRNKIKINFFDATDWGGSNNEADSIHKWELFWSKKIKKEDKYEKNLELKILLYQWFSKEIKEENTLGLAPNREYAKELEQKLTNLKYWQKKKKRALILGIIIALAITLYLMWPNSERPNQETVPNNDWPKTNRPLWL